MGEDTKTLKGATNGINIQNLASLYVNAGFDVNDRTFILGQSLADREAERVRDTISRERSTIIGSPAKRFDSSVEIIGTFPQKNGCVPYAWTQGMQTKGYGWARNYPIQSEPTNFLSTYEGYMGHIVVKEKDLGDSYQVRDANYYTGKITRRIISKSKGKGYVR